MSFKKILILSYIGNGFGLIMFGVTNNYYLQAFARFFSGICQIFHCIYNPLFIDTFATYDRKQF